MTWCIYIGGWVIGLLICRLMEESLAGYDDHSVMIGGMFWTVLWVGICGKYIQ